MNYEELDLKDFKLSEDILRQVLEDLKDYMIHFYSSQLFENYEYKIMRLVYNYLRKLPGFIKTTDQDDLMNIARMEFIQTFRAWNPLANPMIWPFAYSRINGAMRDHIRYLTKADPSRVYSWVTDAAYMYIAMNKNQSEFSGRVEEKVTLTEAMKNLNEVERKIVSLKIVKDLTLIDIGTEVGLSESQVSRLYRGAVEKLKKLIVT